MAEVETHSNSNGKHALEDIDAPIKSKLFKAENGQSKYMNSNGAVQNGTDATILNDEENSTSAATVGDSSLAKGEQSNSTSNNKYEFSESEVGDNSNTNGDLTTNGDETSRVSLEENTSESNGCPGNRLAHLNNNTNNSKNLGENSVDNYGEEDENGSGSDEDVGVEGEEDDEDDDEVEGEDDEDHDEDDDDCGEDDDDEDDDEEEEVGEE